MSCQKFTNDWALSTLELLHQIFTRCKGIIGVVNAHIHIAIFHYISECQFDKWNRYAILPQNWLLWKHPLRNWKNRYRSIICTQSAFIQWKECENWSSWDPKIIVLQEIILPSLPCPPNYVGWNEKVMKADWYHVHSLHIRQVVARLYFATTC